MTIKTIPLPEKSTKEIRDYSQAVKRGMDSYFVVHNGKGWYVRKADSSAGELFGTKSQAIAQARKEAKGHKAEVFIFDKNGKLTERTSS